MENQVENKSLNQQSQIAGAIVIAGLIIGGAILLKGSGSPIPAGAVANTASIELREVSQDEHILGDANAEVVIVEYSDTECPFCKTFHNTLHSALNQNDNVAWVFRHYPIPQLHKKAFHEAEATECAWELGGNDAFWAYIDEVFLRTGSNDRLDVAELPRIASDVGLDVNAFNTCLASGKFKTKVEADMSDGSSAGARGTPYSVLVSKNKIDQKKVLSAVLSAGGRADHVTFASNNDKLMTFNGAIAPSVVNAVLKTLTK